MNLLIRVLLGVVFLGQLTVAFAEPTLLRFAGLIDGVRALSRSAWQSIQRGRIDRLF